MTPTPAPPRLSRALAALWLRGDAREVILGDLDEAFAAAIAAGVPPRIARRRYRRHALVSMVAATGVRRPPEGIPMPTPSTASWFRGLGGDLRYVARMLSHSPGFVAVAVLSLAIGIGANVALFSVMRAVLFQELPVRRPSELRWVYWTQSAERNKHTMNYNSDRGSNYSYPGFVALKEAAAGRADLFGFNFIRQLNVAAADQPAIVANGLIVSSDYFSTLGLSLALGRPLGADDDRPGAPQVAVIGDALWRRLFGGDPTVVGRTVTLNRVPFEIVGVTMPAFHGLSVGGFFPPADVTVPLVAQPIVNPTWAADNVPITRDFDRNWLRVMVRPRPGTDEVDLTQRLTSALQRVEVEAGATTSTGVAASLKPGGRGLDSLRTSTEQPLTILAIVSALVLLIACTNLAGIMLARGVARQRDIAVRRALGASRAALVRQWGLESLILAGAGGLAGAIAAVWSGPILARMLTLGLGAVAIDMPLDWRLLAAATGVTLLTAVLCGVIPAWRLTRGDATGNLRTRVIGAGSPKLTIGRVLIAVQIGISVPLLVGALLFLHTLRNLAAVDLGFEPRGLVVFQLNPMQVKPAFPFGDAMASPEKVRLTRDILDRLEAIPGVSSATILENTLVSGIMSNTSIRIAGEDASMWMNAVGPRFFETMKIPLVAGRELSMHDDAGAPLVAVINRAAADRYFPGQSPLGQTFEIRGRRDDYRRIQIVGVVANSVYDSLKRAPRPVFYDSYLQRPGGTYYTSVAVRTTVKPDNLEAQLRAAVAAADPNLPITNVKTEEDQIGETISKERVFSRLLTLFGGFALLLTCIGLHGLTSYAVARRTSEIGIRLALGAQRSQVLWLILRQVVGLAVAGLAIGVPAALFGSRSVDALLYGVAPRDPWTIAGAALLLLAVAITAGWLPARRAARTEALVALRQE